MAAYAVFEPPPRARDRADSTDRFAFVRDGFGWGPFFLGPLWILWRGLWLVLVGYIVVIAALEGAFRVIDLSVGGRVVVGLLVAVLLGFEGASLRRWTLKRRGWRDLGIVVADDLEAAERRFFEVWVAGRTARSATRPGPPAPSLRMPASQGPDVVGLFPEPGASR